MKQTTNKKINKFNIFILTLIISLIVISPIAYSVDFPVVESTTGSASAQGLLGASSRTANLGEQIAINVADMQPVMVRQSLLEQQNVPVFVYLKGTTIGSLFSVLSDDPNQKDPFSGTTNIPMIKSMTITVKNSSKNIVSGSPRYVAPTRAQFSLSNLGYLIINLKRAANFSKLVDARDYTNLTEKIIDLELQADIYYDLQKSSMFGIGEQQRVLDVVADEKDFMNRILTPYTILGGRAYIRATDITSDSVTLRLYDRSRSLLSLFSPELGSNNAGIQGSSVIKLTTSNPTSYTYSLSNGQNPFTDSFRVRLDKIATPQNTATVSVLADGKTYTRVLRVGEKVSDGSNWIVKEISPISRNNNPSRADLAAMDFDDTLLKTPISELKIDTHSIVIQNPLNSEIKTLSSKVLISGTGLVEVEKLKDETANQLQNTYCPLLLNQGPQSLADNPELSACLAVKGFKELIAKYPDSKEAMDAYLQLAKIYEANLVAPNTCNMVAPGYDVARCMKYKKDMRNLEIYYYQKVIDLNPLLADEAKQKLIEASSKKYDSVTIDDDSYPVTLALLSTDIITNSDKGTARIKIGDYEKDYKIGEQILVNDGVPFKVFDGETEVHYELKSLDSRIARITPVSSGSISFFSTESTSQTLVLGQAMNIPYYTLPRSQRGNTNSPSLMRAELTRVDSKNQAFITILPSFDSARTVTNFSVRIPVEPRPFSYTPDELKVKINDTKVILASLDKTISGLDSIVSTWKRTCIIVFGALIVKNTFLGGTSRNLARKSVSKFYKEDCVKRVAAKEFSTTTECYSVKAEDMEKAIDAEQKAIDAVNARMKSPEEIAKEKDFIKFKVTGGTLEDYREHLKYQELDKVVDKSSPYYTEYVTKHSDDVNFGKRVKLYDEAENFASNVCRYSIGTTDTTDPKYEKCKSEKIPQYITEEQTAKKAGINLGSSSLSNLKAVEGTTNEFSSIVTTDPTTGTKEDLTLVRVTQLQLKVYEAGGLDKFIDELRNNIIRKNKFDATELNNPNVIAELKSTINTLNISASDSNGNDIFVSKDSLTANEIDFQLCVDPKELQCTDKPKYNLLSLDQSNPAFKTDIEQNNIKFYTSPTAKFGDKTLGTKFVPNAKDSIIAQFDENGKPFCYPVKISSLPNQANYVQVLDWYANGEAKIMRLLNAGANGLIECGSGDDVLVKSEDVLTSPPPLTGENQLIKNEMLRAISGKRCINDGDPTGDTINGKKIICSKNSFLTNKVLNSVECIDTMDPSDCVIMFNACDPVMCPTSRCNLAGAYTPKNGVIASGMVGSVILCLPNFPTVKVPICLTGVLSGLKSIRSVYQGYSDCLETNLKSNTNVGICDYINSVGMCEILWRESMSILDIKGGILNWLTSKVFEDPKGGGEYLTFQSALDNVGQSVQAFSKEYSESRIAAIYQGKTTDEFGSEVCRKSVYAKFPTVGTILDQLSEPEDPPQFYAWFDTVPYADPGNTAGAQGTTRTNFNNQELTQYTVFYHIYAGSGFSQPKTIGSNQPITQVSQTSGLRYSVILKGPNGDVVYVTDNPSETGTREATIKSGGYAQKTVNAISKPGLTEICIIINGKQNCGFGRVTTDFALNEAKDRFVEGSQISKKNITNANDCRISTAVSDNKIGNTISPIQSGLLSSTVIRICAPAAPTAETNRWQSVGTCGKDEKGLDLGFCWLDKNSIHIEDQDYKKQLISDLKKGEINPATGQLYPISVYSSADSGTILWQLNKERDDLLKLIEQAYNDKALPGAK